MANIDNILSKIENYKTQAAERAEQERIVEERYRQNLLNQIRAMKPDIDNVIKVAKAAQEAGISIKSEPMTGLHYEDGDFFTDATTHKIGFVKLSLRNQKIIGVGFEGGGCCGNYDFFTDGIAIYDRNRDNGYDREASIEHLEKFIEKFPEFEEMLYAYIEMVINL